MLTFEVVSALLIVAMAATFICWVVGINRRKKLDAADYEELERRLEELRESDLQRAFEILVKIGKRHHL